MTIRSGECSSIKRMSFALNPKWTTVFELQPRQSTSALFCPYQMTNKQLLYNNSFCLPLLHFSLIQIRYGRLKQTHSTDVNMAYMLNWDYNHTEDNRNWNYKAQWQQCGCKISAVLAISSPLFKRVQTTISPLPVGHSLCLGQEPV